MTASLSIILVLGFAIVYILMIEIFSVLFRITGLTKEKSIFQTISLLTTAGFTTSESEVITTNKMRRRIAISAMITGNVFSVIIVSLILNVMLHISETKADTRQFLIVTLISFGAFALILAIFCIPFVRKFFDAIIEKIAITSMKKKNKENAITFLDNYGHGKCIAEILINNVPEMLKDKSLFESKIKDVYNMNVLLIKRKNKILEVTKDTMLQEDDVIVVFGSSQNIKDLFVKKLGKKAK